MTAHHLQSSGRGGAGNIVDSSKSPKLTAQDLQTPVLTKPVVTTGRGGAGNMASNDDPVLTRALQDVEPVIRHSSEEAVHVGRGGEGNVVRSPPPDESATSSISSPPKADADQHHNWLHKKLFGHKK